MATSVLIAATTDHHSTNPSLEEHHDHHPIRPSSGRRKSKGCDSSGGQKKKQPQRGMGVEKLERLRMQDRWKKMTEVNTTNQSFNMINPSFADPTLIHASVPGQFSKLGGFGAPSVAMGFNQNQSYLGFHGQMGYGDGCFSSSSFRGKNHVISGICKELSASTPNVVKCYSDHCNACHKKKKVNGENLGCGRVRSDMYIQMSNNVNGDYGFLGLNVVGPDNQNIISHENQGFGAKLPQLGYAVPSGKTGVEVVAVHKKGSGSGSGSGISSSELGESDDVLMEYEFFPAAAAAGKRSDDEMKKMLEPSSSSFSSSCIDLSLKLSSY